MIRSLIVSFSFLLIWHIPTFAQNSFTKTYGGSGEDVGKSVLQTSDGGYLVCGGTDSYGAGASDVYLIRVDASGRIIWSKTYGGAGEDYGNCVRETSDGGYILVGLTESYGAGNSDVYLIKVDSDGDSVWTRTYGTPLHEEGNSVVETRDQGFILTGWSGTPGTDEIDIYIVKTDASGDTLWTTSGPYIPYEQITRVVFEDPDTVMYHMIGYGQSGGGFGDYDILHVWYSGPGGWFSYSYSGGYTDQVAYSAVMVDHCFVYAGYTNAFGSDDVYLTGPFLRFFGGEQDDAAWSIDCTEDHGYIVAGYTYSYGAGQSDIYVIRTDSSGNWLWESYFGGTGLEEGYDVKQTSDGGYVITGYTNSFGAGNSDVYLIKTNADGQVGIDSTEPLSSGIPRTFALCQNYPNPFNPSTTIDVMVPEDASDFTTLRIFDVRGRLVITLVEGALAAGRHRFTWGGKNNRGEPVPSGVYLYTLKNRDHVLTRKMTLIK